MKTHVERKLDILFAFGQCSKTLPVNGGQKPVRNQATLAQAMEVTQAAVSNWVTNDRIPTDRLGQICDWYGIGFSSFLDDDPETFEARVKGELGAKLRPWRDFATASPITEKPLRLRQSAAMRGSFQFDDEPDALPKFRYGDKVYGELDLQKTERWNRQTRPGGQAYLLMVDMGLDLETLCPRDSIHAPDVKVTADYIRIPTGTASMKITGSQGVRRLLALLTEKPLPETAVESLRQKTEPAETVLDGLVSNIKGGWFGEWGIWRFEYEVI